MANKERERPSVTVDVVVIATRDGQWNVLLVRRKNPPFQGRWAIPGGFVEPNEPLEKAARRELLEETGLNPGHLEQLRAFGDPGRDPRGWTISVAFVTKLDQREAPSWRPRAASDAEEVGWFALEDLPPLAFDHQQILAHAAKWLERHDRPSAGRSE
jgi:8-oxo-dGTP diphosphatase